VIFEIQLKSVISDFSPSVERVHPHRYSSPPRPCYFY